MRNNRSDLPDLTYFLVVAKHQNFRQAGVELGITASAVSHAIKGLEGRLGVRLLNRTNRSVTLTVAGEELRRDLEEPFGAIGHAMERLNLHRDAPTGHIRLNVLVGAADLLLAPVLPEFIRRYPDITVELSVTNQMLDVVGEGFDAGIRFGATLPADMIARRLSPDARWIVAGAPDYFAEHGTPKTPHDLKAHRCMQIRLGNQTLYRWEFEQDGKDLEIDVSGPIILDEGATALKLALQGAGLIYMTEWDVKRHVDEGHLVTVLDDWSASGEGFHIYYPSRRQVPNGVRLLVDLIRELRPLG
ncbi:LysR family transcriptional regulator [Marinibacterium sp. SX1]|uniref:LysR family transcriptional regulator n=1 Tax=Marinibacterium sp. SX1 TaxID=3388424 RepID=UPI003D176649